MGRHPSRRSRDRAKQNQPEPLPSQRPFIVHEHIPLPARRLLELVRQAAPSSKSEAARLIQLGAVRVNGQIVRRADAILELGDRLIVSEDVPQSRQPLPPLQRSTERLRVIYHDTDLIVVTKPAALLTVPTPYRERNTLVSQVDQWLKVRDPGKNAYCVHRLDRGVSGLVVFGKRLAIAEALRDQFAARTASRRYVAIVSGTGLENEGTFRSYLTTDKKTLERRSTPDPALGELAVTHYIVRQAIQRRHGTATVVEAWLETGRRHQIRVHFAEAGHPVLGDPRYCRDPAGRLLWPYKRIALHARDLGFVHPGSGKTMSFQTGLPAEFDRLIGQ